MILSVLDVAELLKLFEDELYRPRIIDELSLRLNTTLAHFLPDPESFREKMRQEGAVIGGAVPLWFAMSQPSAWRPDHLDLIIPNTAEAIFRDYFQSMPGCVIVDPKPYLWELKSQWRFRRDAYCVRTSRGVVRVVCAHQHDPLSAVRFYWGTHLMNVLTADAFVSPYFQLTMARKALGMDARKVMRGDDDLGDDIIRDGGEVDDEDMFDQSQLDGPFVDPRGFSVFESGSGFAKLRNGCIHFVGCCQRDRTWTDRETILVQIGWGGGKDAFHMFRASQEEWRLKVLPCANKSCFMRKNFGIASDWIQDEEAIEALEFEDVE